MKNALHTRILIIQAMDQARGQRLSGQTLARSVGLSRAAVWKAVQSLQRQGFPIRSLSRSGYQFEGFCDASLLDEFAGPGLYGWLITHRSLQIPSTQTAAKLAAEGGAAEGHLWLAEVQTRGRGRLERGWISPYGGIWASLILRPTLAPAEAPPIALIAALALTETLESMLNIDARLKWPNDVVVWHRSRWRKLAGFLTELSGEVDRTHWMILGFGINVFNPIPDALREIAVTLSELTPQPIRRGALLANFLARFRDHYTTFQQKRFAAFQVAYWKRYSRPNERVRLNTAAGAVDATAYGVDPRGGLLIKSGRRTSTVFEGEIVL